MYDKKQREIMEKKAKGEKEEKGEENGKVVLKFYRPK